MLIFSYPKVVIYVVGAQKNRLIETVLLNTHDLCFGRDVRKLIFNFTHYLEAKVSIYIAGLLDMRMLIQFSA